MQGIFEKVRGKRVALYARVSSSDETNKGDSVSAQLTALRKFCEEHQAEIVATYTDEGISGMRSDRPEFERMIAEATTSNRFDFVLIEDYARFSRDRFHSQLYRKELLKHGVSVIATSQPVDEDDPLSSLILSTIEGVNEFWPRMTALQTRQRMMEKMSKGYYATGGRPPLGYKSVNVIDDNGVERRKLEIDYEHIKTIKLIFSLMAENSGGFQTARILREKGITKPDGKHFTKGDILRITENPVYKGSYIWNRYRRTDGKKGRKIENPREKWMVKDGIFPAIIEPDLWEQVQKLRKKRDPRKKKLAVAVKFDLSGKLKCRCGGAMIGTSGTSKSGKLHQYYICNKRIKAGKAACDAPTWKREKLEALIYSRLKKWVAAPETLNELVKEYKKNLGQQSRDDALHIKAVEQKIQAAEMAIDRLFTAFEQGSDNPDIFPRIRQKKKELEELKVVRSEARITPPPPEIDVFSLSQAFSEMLTSENGVKFINTFVDLIEVQNDRILVTYTLNFGPNGENTEWCSDSLKSSPTAFQYTNTINLSA